MLVATVVVADSGTADAEIKAPSVENPELTICLSLKPGTDPNIPMDAHFQECLPCSNFYFSVHSPFFFFKSSPYFLAVLVLANTVSRVGRRNKMTRSTCS